MRCAHTRRKSSLSFVRSFSGREAWSSPFPPLFSLLPSLPPSSLFVGVKGISVSSLCRFTSSSPFIRSLRQFLKTGTVASSGLSLSLFSYLTTSPAVYLAYEGCVRVVCPVSLSVHPHRSSSSASDSNAAPTHKTFALKLEREGGEKRGKKRRQEMRCGNVKGGGCGGGGSCGEPPHLRVFLAVPVVLPPFFCHFRASVKAFLQVDLMCRAVFGRHRQRL